MSKRSKYYGMLIAISLASLNCFEPNFITIPMQVYKFALYFPALFIALTLNNKSIAGRFTTRSVLLDHNKYTKVLSLKSILRQRFYYGSILEEDYSNNKKYISYVSMVPLWKYKVIMGLPMLLIKLIRKLKKNVHEH